MIIFFWIGIVIIWIGIASLAANAQVGCVAILVGIFLTLPYSSKNFKVDD